MSLKLPPSLTSQSGYNRCSASFLLRSARKVLLESCACLKLSSGLSSGEGRPGLSPPPPHSADFSRPRGSPPVLTPVHSTNARRHRDRPSPPGSPRFLVSARGPFGFVARTLR